MLLALVLLLAQSPAPPCADLTTCRQAALEARERKDYEAFHDLAWLTLRKGKPDDAELMLLLARAQSLSGRAGDAIVMLERLAARGVATDVETSDEFDAVRHHPRWKSSSTGADAPKAPASEAAKAPTGAASKAPADAASKAPEGAATGAGTGAVAGGVLGWLAGLGAIAIPGVGPFIAAGPIMAALAGAGVGGTVGGLTGALVGAGIPEYEAKRYEGRIKDGGILVSVHCDNSEWTSRAKDILEKTGAQDVSSAGEASADFAKTDKPLPRDV